MNPISHGLLFLCAALIALSFFGSTVVSVILNARLIKLLQSKHHALWLNLDGPDFWHVLILGGRPFGGIPARSAGAALGSKYFTWLAIDGYKDIDDPVVAAIGERLRKLFLRSIILLTIGVGSFCIGYFLTA